MLVVIAIPSLPAAVVTPQTASRVCLPDCELLHPYLSPLEKSTTACLIEVYSTTMGFF